MKWLDLSLLKAYEQAQLISIFQLFDSEITKEKLSQLNFEELNPMLQEMAECPIEKWDICDKSNQTQYQLWLYYGDSGVIFENQETTVVDQIIRCAFYGDKELGEALHKAQEKVIEVYPDSELASVFFISKV